MLVSLTSVSRKEESYSPDATTEDPAEGLCDMRGTVLSHTQLIQIPSCSYVL